MSADTGVVQQGLSRAGAGRIALTVLLTCALVASVVAALATTFFILYAGWPRNGVVNGAALVLVLAWAPLVVTSVVAVRRRQQQWWTAPRLAIATVAVVLTTGAAWVGLLAL